MAQTRSRTHLQASAGGGAGRAPAHVASVYGDHCASQAPVRRRTLSSKPSPSPCGVTAATAKALARDRSLRGCRSLEEPQVQDSSDHGFAESVTKDGMQFPSAEDTMHATGEATISPQELQGAFDVSAAHGAESDVNGMIQAYERKLKDQNQRFWETAKRMDMALADEEARCAALAEKLKAEEMKGQELVSSQSQLSEAVSNLSSSELEVESLRKAGRERVIRQAADMEALSEKLCNAQKRAMEFEAVVGTHQAEAASARQELQEEALQYQEMTEKFKGFLLLESRLNHEKAVNGELVERQKGFETCESELQQQRYLVGQVSEQLQGTKCQLREAKDAHASEEAQVSWLREKLEDMEYLRRQAAEAGAARAERSQALEDVQHLQSLLSQTEQRMQADASRTEQARSAASAEVHDARSKMLAVQEELTKERAVQAEVKNELRSVEFECEAYSDAAVRSVSESEALKAKCRKSDAQEAESARLVSILRDDLQSLRNEEELQRSFWVKTHKVSEQTEEKAIAAEAEWARKQISEEESAAREAIEAALADAKKSRSQLDSETLRVSNFLRQLSNRDEAAVASAKSMETAEAQLAALESALASEWAAAQSNQSQFNEQCETMRAASAAELAAAHSATEQMKELEEKEAAAAKSESEACSSVLHKVTKAEDKISKLQGAAKASMLETQELETELAQARADAHRHCVNATEFRVELVATKRDLAKQRHAEHELKQAVDEVDSLNAKLRGVQRGREAVEQEAKQGQSRQAALERQVQDLQTRLAAERHAAQRSREQSMRREGSADAGSAALRQAALQLVSRRSPSAEMAPAVVGSSDATPSGRVPSPSAAAQVMCRSHSMGAISSSPRPDTGNADLHAAAQMLNSSAPSDALASLRTSPNASLSHPPRPPQAAAPRMGWATHARSRGDGTPESRTPERLSDVQYNPEETSRSIDRAMR